MSKSEIKIPSSERSYCEEWHSEEDKNVLLRTPDDIMLTTQKAILQPFLKQIKDNVIVHEAEEQKRDKLRASYKVALEKAKILISKKGDALKKKLPNDVILDDKGYFESDSKGNLYVSDDS